VFGSNPFLNRHLGLTCINAQCFAAETVSEGAPAEPDGRAGFQPPGKEEDSTDQRIGTGLGRRRRMTGTPSGRLETRPSEVFETASTGLPYQSIQCVPDVLRASASPRFTKLFSEKHRPEGRCFGRVGFQPKEHQSQRAKPTDCKVARRTPTWEVQLNSEWTASAPPHRQPHVRTGESTSKTPDENHLPTTCSALFWTAVHMVRKAAGRGHHHASAHSFR